MLDHLGQQFPPIDAPSPTSAAAVGLTGRLDSVRHAREFTRTTLLGWRMPEQFDVVALVVSELVTNALRHGLRRQGDCPAGTGRSRMPVELELMRYARRLICAVRDESSAAPRLGAPDEVADPAAESGRGLHLVDCFSDGWGWRPLTGDRPGKVVWAVFKTG